MTTIRSSFALLALVASAALAGAAEETSTARRHHETLAPQQAVAATITADYLAERVTLLQAALRQSDSTACEVALAQPSTLFVSAVVPVPASVQL